MLLLSFFSLRNGHLLPDIVPSTPDIPIASVDDQCDIVKSAKYYRPEQSVSCKSLIRRLKSNASKYSSIRGEAAKEFLGPRRTEIISCPHSNLDEVCRDGCRTACKNCEHELKSDDHDSCMMVATCRIRNNNRYLVPLAYWVVERRFIPPTERLCGKPLALKCKIPRTTQLVPIGWVGKDTKCRMETATCKLRDGAPHLSVHFWGYGRACSIPCYVNNLFRDKYGYSCHDWSPSSCAKIVGHWWFIVIYDEFDAMRIRENCIGRCTSLCPQTSRGTGRFMPPSMH